MYKLNRVLFFLFFTHNIFASALTPAQERAMAKVIKEQVREALEERERETRRRQSRYDEWYERETWSDRQRRLKRESYENGMCAMKILACMACCCCVVSYHQGILF